MTTTYRIRRSFGALCVLAASMVPGAASAQDTFGGLPLPRIEQGPRGITITPMPGVLPVIHLPVQLPGARTMPLPVPPFGQPTAQPTAAPAPTAPSPFPAAPAPFPAAPAPFPAPGAAPMAPSTGGRVVGVFAGISDYTTASDLPFCASDAARVQQAFVNAGIMDPMDSVVLADHQATRGSIANAIERMSRRLQPGDTLVFFFSGHGSQRADHDGDEGDGQDETIELADGAMTDDELTQLLQAAQHRSFVALDTCYSGGFARDIGRLNDSVGFYASREDQLSYVADEYQAGGYLSYYLAEEVQRSQGRPLSTWQLQQGIAQGFQRSGAANRQELTVGTSRSVSAQTVLFTPDTSPDVQVASNTYGQRAF
jgi:hypothetical protein